MKNTKLINALKIAVNALKNDTVFYSWNKHASCNCGIVSQAVLGLTSEDLASKTNIFVKSLKDIDKDIPQTWKNGIKYLCPLTGKSDIEIFNDLFEAGLSKDDIVHMEYMSNPAILEKSGIETHRVKEREEKKLKETIVKQIQKPHPNFFKRLFGYTTIQNVEENIYETVIVKSKVVYEYYKERENLIKYLSAWIDILEEGSSTTDILELTRTELEAELLIAVSNEDYERAQLINDQIQKTL